MIEIRDDLFAKDIAAFEQIPIFKKMLDVVCRTTGMRFAAIARVTDKRWVTCCVQDDLQFGLLPGDELELHSTICNEIREHRCAVVINHVNENPDFVNHPTPAKYGFQSYISVPIILQNGSFYGTLCAIDPDPHDLDNPSVRGMFELFAELISFHLQSKLTSLDNELMLSEERLIHRKLEESSEQLSFAIEAAELGTFDYNPKTRQFAANNRLAAWFGLTGDGEYSLDEALSAVSDQDRDRVNQAIKIALDPMSNGRFEQDYTVIHLQNGRETTLQVKGRVWFDDNRVAYRFNGVAEDITEATIAEAKNKDNQRKLAVIIEAGDFGTYEFNIATGKLVYSKKFYSIFGRPADGTISHTDIISQIHPDDLEARRLAFETAYKTGTMQYEARIIWPDGSIHWMDARGKVYFDPDGEPVQMIGTVRDITREKNFAETLDKTVHERTAQLKHYNDKLEQMNRELQSFAYISSHDLQEPLRKIQTFASWIEEKEVKNLSDEGKSYFKRIENAAGRMQALINDLLAYSRTETSEKNFKKTNLAKVIGEAKSDLFEELEQKDAEILIGPMPAIKVIPFQFRQLMYNLISNSVKFAHSQRRLVIDIKSNAVKGHEIPIEGAVSTGDYFHISVADNGIGFEQQYAPRIFQLFQRLHGKLDYTGTGIGLAIVRKIVDNHNGLISASGVPGQGATFDIYLPVR